MSSVATATIMCSSPLRQYYTEWSITDRSKPNSLMNTLVISMYHPLPACFSPYNPFNSLSTFPSSPGFNTPLGAFM